MSKRKGIFKWIYLVWATILIALVAAALSYVNDLLQDYEAAQPELQVEAAVARLAKDAAGSDFWSKYGLAQPEPGRFETEVDVGKTYLNYYREGELTYTAKASGNEDEMCYSVKNGNFELAEVRLKAAGPQETRLAVFTMREWTLDSVTPILTGKDYTLTVPADFDVKVNGVALGAEDGESKGAEVEYTISGIYLEPAFEIADPSGTPAKYTVRNGKVMVEYYSYSLTLPAALTVKLDGKVLEGTPTEQEGVVHYDITRLAKPEVEIADHYGNVYRYEGGNKLPLTYATVTADERCTVQVSGKDAPDAVAVYTENDQYALVKDYVDNLPRLATWQIAALEENAEITVLDVMGQPVPFEAGEQEIDLSDRLTGIDEVPAEVSAEIDLLDVAQKWSLMMSNDLKFAQLSGYLLPGSYQYEVARKYATGIDITFTSSHVLLDPVFTDNSVTNFTWITEDCFSVDISFVKHMKLTRTGDLVDDPMNDRFYFVRHKDAWKLASMKEILNDAGA